MADSISKEKLRAEIDGLYICNFSWCFLAILESIHPLSDLKHISLAGLLDGADLSSLSAKKVREQLEEKLAVNLSPRWVSIARVKYGLWINSASLHRKKEIDGLLMDILLKKNKPQLIFNGKETEKAAKEPAAKKQKVDQPDDCISLYFVFTCPIMYLISQLFSRQGHCWWIQTIRIRGKCHRRCFAQEEASSQT